MAIIKEGNKHRWNDGPLCDTEDEALKTAEIPTMDSVEEVFTADSVESWEIVD
jgi:hypothetical protein